MTKKAPSLLQAMPQPAAKLCLDVEKFITQELGFDPAGKELTLAFSGGADSKALFYILLALAPRLGFTLSLAHLDHALRAESASELKAAEALAQGFGLAHYTTRVDVAALSAGLKLGKEEAGRVARLQFLQSLKNSNPQRWIVYGHQLNDLAEDVLMRLVRGTGWPSLGGMQGLDEKHRVLRPLLLTSRADIENFLDSLKTAPPQGWGAEKFNWIDDPLNHDQAFLRNRMRAKILPLLLEENPSFLESIADLWRLAAFDGELFAHLLKGKNKTDAAAALSLPHAALADLPKALRLRLYKERLEALGPGQPLLRNLLNLDRAWEKRKSGTVIQFPGHKSARVERGEIKFSKG